MGNIVPNHTSLTDEEQSSVTITWQVCSALSLVSLTVVIFCMALLRQFKRPHHHLVFVMFCATFGIFFFGVLTGDQQYSKIDSAFCTASGFIFQVCWNANIVGVLSISVNLFRSIVLLSPMDPNSPFIFHYFLWTFCLLTAFLPMITHSYGWAGFYCWIDSSSTGSLWRMITLYWPMIGYDLAMLFIYGTVLYTICSQRSLLPSFSSSSSSSSTAAEEDPPSFSRKFSNRFSQMSFAGRASDAGIPTDRVIGASYIKFMIFYPLIFFICTTPGLVNRYYSAYTGVQSFGLFMAQAISVGLMGLAYSLVFGWVVFRHWREILLRLRMLPILCREKFCPERVMFIRDSPSI